MASATERWNDLDLLVGRAARLLHIGRPLEAAMLAKQVYFGCFENYTQMLAEWGTDLKQPVPAEHEVLFASYGLGICTGDAIVLFEHRGQLYEVNGSHCSCHGLGDGEYPSLPSSGSSRNTHDSRIHKRRCALQPAGG